MKKIIAFGKYYVKLRARTLLGVYQTTNPMGLKWRWHQWKVWNK